MVVIILNIYGTQGLVDGTFPDFDVQCKRTICVFKSF